MTAGTKGHCMQSCSVAWCALSSTWNALRYATWDCVFKWKAIKQAIQCSTALKSCQEHWGCGIARTFTTAAFWWTWTSKPKETFLSGKQPFAHAHLYVTLHVEFIRCEMAPKVRADSNLFSLSSHQRANVKTPEWLCSHAFPQKREGKQNSLLV